MGIYIGVDCGAVSVKAACLLSGDQAALASRFSSSEREAQISRPGLQVEVVVSAPRRAKGRPLEAVHALFAEFLRPLSGESFDGLVVTGSGGALVASTMGAGSCNEFQALARAMGLLHPEVRTVLEIGGESSKYLRLEPDGNDGELGISDYSTNGDCAAGTGGFLDQQAFRLKYAVEDIGGIVAGAARTAQIAGRCSVFAKSDMIHAQQKGFTPPEVLAGLCKAVAVNYKSAVAKGRTPKAPVALVGGVSANAAVVRELREAFGLADGELAVPLPPSRWARSGPRPWPPGPRGQMASPWSTG